MPRQNCNSIAVFAVTVCSVFCIYVLINLLVFFLMTMKDIANTAHTSVNLMLGLYTWLAGIIALVICGIGGYDPTYVYLIIGVCQVIQVCIILIQLIAKKRFLAALAASLLYIYWVLFPLSF